MAIRIKYDPVGSLFLGSYAMGEEAGRERRARDWMLMRQRELERLQAARERAADRQFQAQRDFMRQNVNLGPVGPVAGGAQAAGGLAAGMIGGPAGMLGAAGMAGLPAVAGEQAPMFVDRDLLGWQQQQQAQEDRQNQAQQEADLAFRRRQYIPTPPPAGVAQDPQATAMWNDIQTNKGILLGGREFNPDLPESREALEKFQQQERDLIAKHPKRTTSDMLNEESAWRDPKTGIFYPDQGDPALGREQYLGGQPANQKAQQDEQQQDQGAIAAQRGVAADALKKRLADIATNDDLVAEIEKAGNEAGLTPEQIRQRVADERAKLSQQAWDEYNKMWGPGGSAYGKAAPPAAPPPAGQPGAAVAPPSTGAHAEQAGAEIPRAAGESLTPADVEVMKSEAAQGKTYYAWPDENDPKNVLRADPKTGKWSKVTEPREIQRANMNWYEGEMQKIMTTVQVPEGYTGRLFDLLSPADQVRFHQLIVDRDAVKKWSD